MEPQPSCPARTVCPEVACSPGTQLPARHEPCPPCSRHCGELAGGRQRGPRGDELRLGSTKGAGRQGTERWRPRQDGPQDLAPGTRRLWGVAGKPCQAAAGASDHQCPVGAAPPHPGHEGKVGPPAACMADRSPPGWQEAPSTSMRRRHDRPQRPQRQRRGARGSRRGALPALAAAWSPKTIPSGTRRQLGEKERARRWEQRWAPQKARPARRWRHPFLRLLRQGPKVASEHP